MKRKTMILLAVLAMLCVLTACKKEEGPLESYSLDEADTVVALDTILGEGEAVLASIDAPTDVAVNEGLEVARTYHYRKMDDPAALAARYVQLLRSSENGFQVLDSENRQNPNEPDMEVLAGSVILGKAAAENEAEGDRIFRVVVGWSEYAVAVQLTYIDGKILPPPVEEEPEEASQPKAMTEQLEYFNGLNPEKLGLVGDDMNDYTVYPRQGWVLVDDIPCREMDVYLENIADGSNVFKGAYFLSNDLSRLFMRTEDNRIVVVELE